MCGLVFLPLFELPDARMLERPRCRVLNPGSVNLDIEDRFGEEVMPGIRFGLELETRPGWGGRPAPYVRTRFPKREALGHDKGRNV
jgi:hypothetical protein